MFWPVLWVVCPLLLLLVLLYIVWKNAADADLTLLWKEQFGHKAGEMSTVLLSSLLRILCDGVDNHACAAECNLLMGDRNL